eukprot:g1020.t1
MGFFLQSPRVAISYKDEYSLWPTLLHLGLLDHLQHLSLSFPSSFMQNFVDRLNTIHNRNPFGTENNVSRQLFSADMATSNLAPIEKSNLTSTLSSNSSSSFIKEDNCDIDISTDEEVMSSVLESSLLLHKRQQYVSIVKIHCLHENDPSWPPHLQDTSSPLHWYRESYVRLYIVKAEDVNSYKRDVQGKLRKWVEKAEKENAEWLIVYIPMYTALTSTSRWKIGGNNLKTKSQNSKVFEKISSDFEGNFLQRLPGRGRDSKHSRVIRVEMSDSNDHSIRQDLLAQENGNFSKEEKNKSFSKTSEEEEIQNNSSSKNLMETYFPHTARDFGFSSSSEKKQNGAAKRSTSEDSWIRLASAIKHAIIRSFVQRCEKYKSEISRLWKEKDGKKLNSSQYILLRESFALLWESFGFHSMALYEYDCIQAQLKEPNFSKQIFWKQSENESKNHDNLPFQGHSLLSCASTNRDKIHKLIQTDRISKTELDIYIFVRQLVLLFSFQKQEQKKNKSFAVAIAIDYVIMQRLQKFSNAPYKKMNENVVQIWLFDIHMCIVALLKEVIKALVSTTQNAEQSKSENNARSIYYTLLGSIQSAAAKCLKSIEYSFLQRKEKKLSFWWPNKENALKKENISMEDTKVYNNEMINLLNNMNLRHIKPRIEMLRMTNFSSLQKNIFDLQLEAAHSFEKGGKYRLALLLYSRILYTCFISNEFPRGRTLLEQMRNNLEKINGKSRSSFLKLHVLCLSAQCEASLVADGKIDAYFLTISYLRVIEFFANEKSLSNEKQWISSFSSKMFSDYANALLHASRLMSVDAMQKIEDEESVTLIRRVTRSLFRCEIRPIELSNEGMEETEVYQAFIGSKVKLECVLYSNVNISLPFDEVNVELHVVSIVDEDTVDEANGHWKLHFVIDKNNNNSFFELQPGKNVFNVYATPSILAVYRFTQIKVKIGNLELTAFAHDDAVISEASTDWRIHICPRLLPATIDLKNKPSFLWRTSDLGNDNNCTVDDIICHFELSKLRNSIFNEENLGFEGVETFSLALLEKYFSIVQCKILNDDSPGISICEMNETKALCKFTIESSCHLPKYIQFQLTASLKYDEILSNFDMKFFKEESEMKVPFQISIFSENSGNSRNLKIAEKTTEAILRFPFNVNGKIVKNQSKLYMQVEVRLSKSMKVEEKFTIIDIELELKNDIKHILTLKPCIALENFYNAQNGMTLEKNETFCCSFYLESVKFQHLKKISFQLNVRFMDNNEPKRKRSSFQPLDISYSATEFSLQPNFAVDMPSMWTVQSNFPPSCCVGELCQFHYTFTYSNKHRKKGRVFEYRATTNSRSWLFLGSTHKQFVLQHNHGEQEQKYCCIVEAVSVAFGEIPVPTIQIYRRNSQKTLEEEIVYCAERIITVGSSNFLEALTKEI